MFERSLIVTVLVGALVASVGVAAAQEANQSATVRAPIGVQDANLNADQATLLLGEGDKGADSLVATANDGSVFVWTKRTPCFAEDENQCVESDSEVSRTSYPIDESSITLAPRQDRSDRTVLVLSEGGKLHLSAAEAGIGVRQEDETIRFSNDDQAPAGVNRAKLTEGLDVAAPSANGSLDGNLRLQTAGTTLTISNDTGERELVTGYSWEDSSRNGFPTERVLRLVRVEVSGILTFGWDGKITSATSTPLGVEAGTALVNVTEGELAGVTPDNGTEEVSKLEATVTGFGSDDEGPTLSVQQGLNPAQAPAPDTTQSEDDVSSTTVFGLSGAALAAVGLVAYYWPRLSWAAAVGVMPLYSRIEKDELFENDVREQLYETIQDDPGVHAHALSEEADIGWGTTVYHLRRLERNGFVKSEKRGRYRRFFPASGFMERQREVLSVLQNETTRDIAQVIRDQPGLNQSSICEELDISPSLANWHLNRLIDAELVNRERRGRTVHYTPGEAWDALEQAVDVEVDEVLDSAAAA